MTVFIKPLRISFKGVKYKEDMFTRFFMEALKKAFEDKKAKGSSFSYYLT